MTRISSSSSYGVSLFTFHPTGFAKFAEELEQELGIPVLDGVVCAVKMAEGIVELGKKTSKAKTYRPPESKSFTGMFERFGSRSPELQKKAG